jgi:hypothetical protein
MIDEIVRFGKKSFSIWPYEATFRAKPLLEKRTVQKTSERDCPRPEFV